jgi:type II secretory pathway pseudopilin PulG
MQTRRAGFGAFELLVVVAVLGFIIGVILAGIQKARAAAQRIESANNLRNLGFALQNYEAGSNELPPGRDDKGFSAYAYLLDNLELGNVQSKLDMEKPATDKANDAARKIQVKVFMSPRDPVKPAGEWGVTNYLFCAGPKAALKDNTGAFAPGKKWTLAAISNQNGTAQTVFMGETLRGDGAKKAVSVKRQHVVLKKDALKEFKDDTGVEDFKDNTNIVADRGGTWLEGRFLQTLFTGTRLPDDPRPDVDCGGLGGLSALRSLDGSMPLVFADNHVGFVQKNIDPKVWKAITDVTNQKPIKGVP